MEHWVPQLGRLIESNEHRRDAIHVAVAPVIATTRLLPGQRIGLAYADDTEDVAPADDIDIEAIGIVDPFLTEPVEEKQRFWMCLLPGTITGLRHVWSHPALKAAEAAFRRKVT
jgi:hypothetical protein